MKTINGANIFKVGTHNRRTFTVQDLDDIVSAFNEAKSAGRVPLKFGHNDEQPITDGKPALGWVSRVWRQGNDLMANFTDVPEAVYQSIQKGLYKFTSIELLTNASQDGKQYPYLLDAVALLGAEAPAVSGLESLQRLAASRENFGGERLSFSVETSNLPDGDTEATVVLNVVNADSNDLDRYASAACPLPLRLGAGPVGQITALSLKGGELTATVQVSSDLAKQLSSGKYKTLDAIVSGNPKVLIGATIKGLNAQHSRDDDELTRLRAENAALLVERQNFTRTTAAEVAKQHQADIITEIERYVRDGKLLPRQRTQIIKMFNLTDERAALKFSRTQLKDAVKLFNAADVIKFLRSSTATTAAQDTSGNETQSTQDKIVMRAAELSLKFPNKYPSNWDALSAVIAESQENQAFFAETMFES